MLEENFLIRSLSDVEEIEKIPYSERITEKSTIELLEKGATIYPDRPAISFLLNGLYMII